MQCSVGKKSQANLAYEQGQIWGEGEAFSLGDAEPEVCVSLKIAGLPADTYHSMCTIRAKAIKSSDFESSPKKATRSMLL